MYVCSRKNFGAWWRSKWSVPLLGKLPSKGLAFDFYIDTKEIKFENWNKIVPEIEYHAGTPMGSVTVPTPETTALDFFMDLLIKLKRPVMCVGAAGSGKTQLTMGKLKELTASETSDYMFQVINFNYYTDAATFLLILESVLEKKAGRNFGPPGTSKVLKY